MQKDKDILETYGSINTTFGNRISERLLGGSVCSGLDGGNTATIYGHGGSVAESLRSLMLELRSYVAAAVDDLDGGAMYSHYGEYDVFEEQDWLDN